ncbi:type 3 dihydrofolate reductase [Aliidiomarina sedimenti]|uniref:Dihydrofolate reductase n=1 Tax=Aliidiomarina sedimenti TaxID=1933879 RepID=A0ABY0BYU2_9GAMM|nr:type 3 dihydrofolate reductase [Aliidiomarina sedimenti]RUO29794.1 type 3 dihydrofolate reductase [Aliidiomarina sedimenti]
MHISLVAAMAANRVIGKGGDMPWHLPKELKYFKEITLGKPVVMGRRTYESIGRPLPGRHNIVISGSNPSLPDEVSVVSSVDEALQAAGAVDEIMVIGGGEIYRQFLPVATRLYLTEIDLVVDGDTWFPEFNSDEWSSTILRDIDAEDENTPAFRAKLLEKNDNVSIK